MGGNFIVTFLHTGLFLMYSFTQCVSLFDKNFNAKRIFIEIKLLMCVCV